MTPAQAPTRIGLPEIVSVGLVAVLFVVLLLQVVLRPFGLGFVWAEEFAAFAFIAIVFFSIAAAYRRGEHMVVEAFHDWAAPRLSRRQLAAWNAGVLTLEFAFLAVLAIGLAQMSVQSWGTFAGSLSGFRWGWLYLATLAAMLLALASVAAQLVAALRSCRQNVTT